MLPSNKRLSRLEFNTFISSKDIKVVFNKLGTLKYKDNKINQASIVVSSKQEKSAVYRNKTRRRLYSLFSSYFKKEIIVNRQYVLYVSKQAIRLSFDEISTLFHELLKKTTK